MSSSTFISTATNKTNNSNITTARKRGRRPMLSLPPPSPPPPPPSLMLTLDPSENNRKFSAPNDNCYISGKASWKSINATSAITSSSYLKIDNGDNSPTSASSRGSPDLGGGEDDDYSGGDGAGGAGKQVIKNSPSLFLSPMKKDMSLSNPGGGREDRHYHNHHHHSQQQPDQSQGEQCDYNYYYYNHNSSPANDEADRSQEEKQHDQHQHQHPHPPGLQRELADRKTTGNGVHSSPPSPLSDPVRRNEWRDRREEKPTNQHYHYSHQTTPTPTPLHYYYNRPRRLEQAKSSSWTMRKGTAQTGRERIVAGSAASQGAHETNGNTILDQLSSLLLNNKKSLWPSKRHNATNEDSEARKGDSHQRHQRPRRNPSRRIMESNRSRISSSYNTGDSGHESCSGNINRSSEKATILETDNDEDLANNDGNPKYLKSFYNCPEPSSTNIVTCPSNPLPIIETDSTDSIGVCDKNNNIMIEHKPKPSASSYYGTWAKIIMSMSCKFSERGKTNNRKPNNNVFTLFNLLLVLLCLLHCVSNCQRVNCLQLVNSNGKGEGGGESQKEEGKLVEVGEDVDVDGSGWKRTNASDLVSQPHLHHQESDEEHSMDKRSIYIANDDNSQNSNQSRFDDGYGGGGANGTVILSRDNNKSIQFSDPPPVGESDPSSIDGEGGGRNNKEKAIETDISGGGGGGGSSNNDSMTLGPSADQSQWRDRQTKTNDNSKSGTHHGEADADAGNQHDEPSPFEKMSGDGGEQPPLGKKDHNLVKNMSSPFSSGKKSSPNKRGSRSVCRLSEFVCKGGKCISADKYCDGVDDCGDGAPSSDEPRFCTPCNRTYYGELGSTYHISLSSETIAAALGLNHPQQMDPSSQGAGGGGSGGHGGPVIFVCHLTFFAAGDNFGDLVQLMFDSVNIGQFVSSVMDGCPEGSLQVAEISRPITGGQWCGSGAGFSVYFSEMSTMTLTLIVGGPSLHSNKQLSSSPNSSLSHITRPIDAFPGSRSGQILPGSSHQSSPMIPPPPPPEFDFKMRYKFIPHGLAAVRYGLHGSPIERGQLEPGTYCNRILEQCHRRRCKIQSPNYPGLYPRNVSCHFTVRQRDKPQCKRVLVQVSQSRSHKVQLRSLLPGPQLSGMVMGSSGISANDPTASMAVDTFMTWDDCNWSRDRIVIYDGNNADAPVILSICGGSHIPPVTSSGPEIHIAFHSTPFGNPLGPVPPPPFPAPLRGFELDVDVVLVDSESADYSNTPNCTFYFVSSKSGGKGQRAFKLQQEGGNWITGVTGSVSSPRHTLPPNTTCRYEFKGSENEAIWIYFVSYRRDAVKDAKRLVEGNCTTRMTIRDGLLGHGQPRALLGSFCDSELPKLCEHKALQNETRLVRACTANESYISAGASLIVEQQFLEGTALRPLHYKFHYEFVNRHPAGMEGSCSRHFHMGKMKAKKGTIRTTDNIFDFGRGGKRNLTCTYTFTMGTHDGLKLNVLKSSFGDRPCRTQTDLETGRYVCKYFVPLPPTGIKSNIMMQNDTLSALANASYPTHHPFFAADHPGGNNTGGGADGSHHHHHYHSQHKFPKSELVLEEYIWTGVNISSHRNCICSNSSRSSGYTWTFLGRKIQLTFSVENMRGQDRYENFFVELEYEILKGEGCRGDNHYMKTESGLISLESYFSYGPRDKPPTCDHYPWLLEAKENHSLYLRIPGFAMLEEKKRVGGQQQGPKVQGLMLHNLTGAIMQRLAQDEESSASSSSSSEQEHLMLPFTANSLMNTSSSSKPSSTLTGSAIFQLDRICPTTKNRIFVHNRDNRLVQKICPSSNHQMSKKNIQVVELYSEEFYQLNSPLYPPPRPRFIIEFVGRELGTYRINWLEVMSARMKTALKAMQTDFVGRATIAGRGLGANFSDAYKKELNKLTSSWDETLTAMFEGQNGYDPMGGHGQSPGTGGDSVHLVDERPPTPPPVCSSYCPELRACISEKLWCDGEIHCPLTKMDETSCDSFWLTVGQLLSPAVYVPMLAAVVSALCCCFLVMLCVGVKKMILSSRFKRHRHHHHHHRAGRPDGGSSMGSSCTSTVDRRTLPPRDWTLEGHDPLS